MPPPMSSRSSACLFRAGRPDENHPYGHRKYETMASLGILVFLVIVLV